MTDTPMIPADVAAARVAAAYEAAALMTGPDPSNEIATAIRAGAAADPDGQAALARLLAEARAEGMREAASQIMTVAKSLPVQHESKERGKCTYNWARWAEGIILAAADKVAAK